MSETERTLKIRISKDDDCEGFAGFLAGSVDEGAPQIILNVYATLACALDNGLDARKLLVENLMHEFGHVLEEYLRLEFDEEFIERCVASYCDKYGWAEGASGAQGGETRE